MAVTQVVINASPLILLCNSDFAALLPQMFTDIVVPEAVWQEIVASPHQDRAARLLPELHWLQKVAVTNAEPIVRWDLGAGETAVLSFALQQRAYTPILDDLAAKKCAKSCGIQPIGTGAILILAKERGLIGSVAQALCKLRNAGLWISDAMFRLLKDRAGE